MNPLHLKPRQLLVSLIILGLLLVDFFEFHDLFEAKTLPEYLTGLLSIPIIALLLDDLLSARRHLWASR